MIKIAKIIITITNIEDYNNKYTTVNIHGQDFKFISIAFLIVHSTNKNAS